MGDTTTPRIRHISEVVEEHIQELTTGYIVEEAEGINLRPSSGYDYVIEWDQCDTYEKILDWQEHLADKKWASVSMMVQFATAACRHHSLPNRRGVAMGSHS